MQEPLYATFLLRSWEDSCTLVKMPKTEDGIVRARCQVDLTGSLAEKVLRIVEREGNPLTAVCRRLISVGLRHEPEENDDP